MDAVVAPSRVGHVRLWVATPSDLWLEAVPLATGDLKRAERLTRPAARDAYVLSRRLLHHVLERLAGIPPGTAQISRRCEWCGDPRHGRPRLEAAAPGPPVEFSVSRAGNVAVVAVSDRALGIDIEPEWPRVASPPDRLISSPAELTALERRWGRPLPPPALTPWWTAREAVGKARGSGLVGMAGLALLPGPADEWLPVSDGGRKWHVRNAPPAPGYLAAVATDRPFTMEWCGPG